MTPAQDKLSIIRSLRAAGYLLMPLRGKTPIIQGWTDRAKLAGLNLSDEKMAEGNYGVVLDVDDLVIDIDPRNFKNGENSLHKLLSVLGAKDLKSFTVMTGGGGAHIYFKKPADTTICHSHSDFPGIEFATYGRQVVGPGSIHPVTLKPYRIARGLECLTAAPALLLDFLKVSPVLTSVKASKGDEGITRDDVQARERFISYLRTAPIAIEGRNGDNTTYVIACKGRDFGLSSESIYSLMAEHWNPKCQPPWDLEALRIKVFNAHKYAKNTAGVAHPAMDFAAINSSSVSAPTKDNLTWSIEKNGALKKTFHNLLNQLRRSDGGIYRIFGYNEFTNRVEFINPAPWHKGILPICLGVGDDDLKLLKEFLSVKLGQEVTISVLEEAVLVVSKDIRFHPVREYLESLTWDKTPRLETWLRDFCGADDTAYVRACAKKTLCAAVMRVMRPGCKFDHVLLLEGEQGIGKSAVCRILGGKWAGDFSVDPHNKDTVQLMQGHWIIELAELEVATKADGDALKAFLTRQVDKVRPAYGRMFREFPRQNIFIGTKNPGADGEYLKDDTGNRRWWPVVLHPRIETGRIDYLRLKEMRNQLFAEAVHWVSRDGNGNEKGGEALYMDTPKLAAEAREVALTRQTKDPWGDIVLEWLCRLSDDRNFITAKEIYLDCLGGNSKQFGRREAMRIAGAMRSAGWKSTTKRDGDKVFRGYMKSENNGVADPLHSLL